MAMDTLTALMGPDSAPDTYPSSAPDTVRDSRLARTASSTAARNYLIAGAGALVVGGGAWWLYRRMRANAAKDSLAEAIATNTYMDSTGARRLSPTAARLVWQKLGNYVYDANKIPGSADLLAFNIVRKENSKSPYGAKGLPVALMKLPGAIVLVDLHLLSGDPPTSGIAVASQEKAPVLTASYGPSGHDGAVGWNMPLAILAASPEELVALMSPEEAASYQTPMTPTPPGMLPAGTPPPGTPTTPAEHLGLHDAANAVPTGIDLSAIPGMLGMPGLFGGGGTPAIPVPTPGTPGTPAPAGTLKGLPPGTTADIYAEGTPALATGVNKYFVFVFPAAPAGYVWAVNLPGADSKAAKFNNAQVEYLGTTLSDDGTTTAKSFRGVGAGTTPLHFLLVPQRDDVPQTPLREFTTTVQVLPAGAPAVPAPPGASPPSALPAPFPFPTPGTTPSAWPGAPPGFSFPGMPGTPGTSAPPAGTPPFPAPPGGGAGPSMTIPGVPGSFPVPFSF